MAIPSKIGDPGFACVRDIRDWYAQTFADRPAPGFEFNQTLEREGRHPGAPRLADGTPDYCAIARQIKQNVSVMRAPARRAAITKEMLTEPTPRYRESKKLRIWLDRYMQ